MATKTEKIECHVCWETITDDVETVKTASGKTVCKDCAVQCHHCDENFEVDDMTYVEDGYVCSYCFDSFYTICDGCDGRFNRNNTDWARGRNGYCVECTAKLDIPFPSRSWKYDKSLLDGKAGKIIKSTRAFGLENEVSGPNNKAIKEVGEVNTNIGITSDSGAEYQTPPASGDKAEKLIHDFSAALEKHKFRVGNGQGLHIHIDASDLKGMSLDERFKRIQSLWLFYIVFDRVMRSFITPYRQNNAKNDHMYGKNVFSFEQIEACQTLAQIEQIWYSTTDDRYIAQYKSSQKNSTRYKGFNLHMLLAAYHLEIRYHESTIDSRAMLEWANLHCTIMDKAVNGEITLEWLRKVASARLLRHKMFDFLGLSLSSKVYFVRKQKSCAA